MGTPAFGVQTLSLLHAQGHTLLVVSQPNKPVGRKKVWQDTPIAAHAKTLGLTLIQPEKINDAYEALKAFNPELILTAAYGQYVPSRILALPSLDCINLHASLLPRHRGGAPIQRALLEGDEKTGISVMRMVKTLDGGPVFTQVAIPIGPTDTSETLFETLAELAPQALMQAWEAIVKRQSPTPQEDTLATLAPNLSRGEERLDFTQDATRLDRHIRAFYPAPATYTTYEGKRLKVYRATPLDDHYPEAPGTIVALEGEGILVACGQGAIRLEEVQLEGKKRLPIEAFIQGIPEEKLLKVTLGS